MKFIQPANKIKWLVMLCGCLISVFSHAQSWQLLGPDDENQPYHSWVSESIAMALDTNDMPYMVFSITGGQYIIRKYDTNSNEWSTLTTTSFNSTYYGDVDLLIDDNNYLHLMYNDGDNGNKLTIQKYDMTADQWSVVGSAGFSIDDNVSNTSLTLGKDGTPYVGYTYYSSGNKSIVQKYDTSSSQWVTLGPQNIATNTYDFELVLDGNDSLYVAYRDYGNGNKATVRKYDEHSDTWMIVGTAGFSADDAYYISMVIDSQDSLYVSYRDIGNDYKATVQKYDQNSDTWIVLDTVGFSAGSISSSTLVIDQNDSLYIAYSDQANGSRVTVQKYDENSDKWVVVGTEGFSAGYVSGYYSDQGVLFKIGKNNVPYVSYLEGYDYDMTPRMETYDATIDQWIPTGTAGIANGRSYYVDIEADRNNVPYILYSTNSQLSVKKYETNTDEWNLVGPSGFATSYYTSMALDTNNIPFVVYEDRDNDSKATVQKYDVTTNQWVVVGTAGFSADGAENPSIAFDENNILYVAYEDDAHSKKITVQKYDAINDEWNLVGNAGFSPTFHNTSYYYDPVISFDGNNIPYVGYRYYTSYAQRILVQKYDSTSNQWTTVGPQYVGEAYSSHFAVSKDNIPYVAYTHDDNYNPIVKKYDAATNQWITIGDGTISSSNSYNIKLFIDQYNFVYIVFRDGENDYKPTVKRYDSNTDQWILVGDAGFSAGTAFNMDLTVTDDSVVVAYSGIGIFAKSHPLTINAFASESQSTSCDGGDDGAASVTVAYGVAPYTVNGQQYTTNPFIITGLTNGTHTFTITDSDNGMTTAEVTISSPVDVTTIAGSTQSGSTDAQGTSASFSDPQSMVTDNSGNIYVVDQANAKIRKIDAQGNVTTFAGSGTNSSVDGQGTSASFYYPSDIAIDGNGNLYVTEQSAIRKIDTQGNVTTLSLNTSLFGLAGIVLDPNDNIYVITSGYYNNAVKKIDAQGNVSTIAGGTLNSSVDGQGTAAGFNYPSDIGIDGNGNLYVAEYYSIRKIDAQANVTTIAGTGTSGYADGQGTNAAFSIARKLTVTSGGDIYICDQGNYRIRKLDSQGNVSTVAGTGTSGYTDGQGTVATFTTLSSIAAGTGGMFYIADGNTIRQLTVTPCLSANAVGTVATTCYNSSDGEALFTVLDGTAPFTVNGQTFQSSPFTVTGLPGGQQLVTLTDATGTSIDVDVTVTKPADPDVTITITHVSCNGGNDGVLSITIDGVTQTLSNLIANTYNFTFTDAIGCNVDVSATITEPDVLAATDGGSTPVSCNGANGGNTSNGTATVNVTGGTTPYTYLWDDVNAQTTATAVGLSIGTYHVTVTDANNCTAMAMVVVTEPAAVVLSSTTTAASCAGGSDGTATVNAVGGAGGYTYLWSNAQTTAIAMGLDASEHDVTVMDSKGCTAVDTVTVTEPSGMVVTDTVTHLKCNGDSDGTISIAVTGGAGQYTYLWSNQNTSTNLTGLTAGDYTVIITDANNCTLSKTIAVTEPTALAGQVASTSVSCNGGADGSVNIQVSGGTVAQTYTYNWENQANIGVSIGTTDTIPNLTAGIYNVTVTDDNGCEFTTMTTVTEPTTLMASDGGSTPVSCNNANDGTINDGTATVNVTGGTAPYTYLWDDANAQSTATATGLSAGTYNVTVTDSNNCTSTASVTVTEPIAITLTLSTTIITCNGGSDGAASVVATGGAGGYNYAWNDSNNQTSATATGLSVNDYMVTVTDANGCTATDTVTVTEPTIVSVSSAKTDVSCFGGNDGTISLTTSGGTGTYTYLWSDQSTDQDRTGLTAGSYSVTVTDQNNCQSSQHNVMINEPAAALQATENIVNTSCNGSNDGSISVLINGGTSPYAYNWENASSAGTSIGTTDNIANAVAGTYNVTITDANNCELISSYTITQPNAIVVTATTTNITCFGQADGTIDISVTNGVPNYTYEWVNTSDTTTIISTNEDLTNLAPGTYKVIVTDNNGCTTTYTETITEPDLITVTPVITNVSCHGGNDGKVVLTVSTGLTQNFSNLPAGTYSFNLFISGCSFSISATVTQPAAPLSVTATASEIVCHGINDATATVTAVGGTAPYTYLWNDENNQTTSTANNLSGGTYTVTVTDANGCIETISATVNDQTQPIVISGNTTNTNCNGAADGAIDITASGGAGSLTYSWSNQATSEDINNLVAGDYTVTVTDASQCEQTAQFTISEPTTLSITEDNNAPIQHVTCNGGSNGAATIIATGGTTPYTYTWTDEQNNVIGGNATSANNLVAGTYTVVVKDANNCSATHNFTITEPDVLSVTTDEDNTQNVPCHSGSGGVAAVSVMGGTTPYTYTWTDAQNMSVSGDTASINNLSAGTYIVMVTDANECSVTHSISITGPNAPLAVSTTTTDIQCNEVNDGTATVIATDGTAPYSYSWDNNDTTNTIDSLSAGTYTVTVTDHNGCTQTTSVTINDQTQPITITGITSAVGCHGQSDGAINITPNGGAGAFTYSWSNQAITEDLTKVAAGDYMVTVTDGNQCPKTEQFTVVEPDSLSIGADDNTTQNVSCNGGNDGTITIIVTGGTTPYTYDWKDNQNNTISGNETISNLTAGTYYVTVTDANQCEKAYFVSVSEPNALSIVTDANKTKAVNCNGGSDGVVGVTVTGGTLPYSYLWTDNQNNTVGSNAASVDNLAAGTYTIIVTDANQCQATHSVTLSEPMSSITLANGGSTNVSCNGGNDGSATVTAAGGTPSYTYTWSDANAQTTATATNLVAGTYTVTVTDANGCTATQDFTITEPTALTLTNDGINNVSCNGADDGSITINVSGGTPSYAYAWNKPVIAQTSTSSLTLTGLQPDDYSISVTDANNCQEVFTFTITEPTALTASVSTIDITCDGNTGGQATITTTGGTMPYTYLWSDGQTAATATNLVAGTHTVTITDANDCTIIENISINQPTALSANITVDNHASCPNSTDGQATVAVTGGTTPYTYSWSNGQTTTTATNLAAGTHTVTITDAGNCTTTESVTITDIDDENPTIVECGQTLTLTLDVNNAATLSDTDLTVNDNCGIQSIIFTNTLDNTSGSSLSFDCTHLGVIPVSVMVTDVNGNTANCTVNITLEDDVAPVIEVCNQVITLALGTDGMATLSSSSLTITDNCGVSSVTMTNQLNSVTDTTLSFDCGNLSNSLIPVAVTATDASGNSTQCFVFVFLQDTEAPTVEECGQVVDLVLDATGNATLSSSSFTINDNCGVQSISLMHLYTGAMGSTLSFACSDVAFGVIPILVTVTDINGNTQMCVSYVQVKDTQLPTIAECNQMMTLTLDGSGNAVLDTSVLTITDNCDLQSVTFLHLYTGTMGSSLTFTSVDVAFGLIPILVDVTDASGNTAMCLIYVTIANAPSNLVQQPTTTLADSTFSQPKTTATKTNSEETTTYPIVLNAFPNPFKDLVNIQYTLTEATEVSITIYNSQGKVIDNIAPIHRLSGEYQFTWQPTVPLSEGMYFITLTTTNGQRINEKILHIK